MKSGLRALLRRSIQSRDIERSSATVCIRYQSSRPRTHTCGPYVRVHVVPCLWQGRFGIFCTRAKHLSQPQKAKPRSQDRRASDRVRFRFLERFCVAILNLSLATRTSDPPCVAYDLLPFFSLTNAADHLTRSSPSISIGAKRERERETRSRRLLSSYSLNRNAQTITTAITLYKQKTEQAEKTRRFESYFSSAPLMSTL